MTEIVVVAAPADQARAGAIADALAVLGFDAAAQEPTDVDLAKVVDEAKCVLALWSADALLAPWLAVQAALALEREKLVCVDLDDGAAPAPFRAAPIVSLAVRDRLAFKERFEALVETIEKFTPTEGDANLLPEALMKARGALGVEAAPPVPSRGAWKQWGLVGAAAAAVAVALFAVGVGARRLLESQPMLVAATAEATPTIAIADGYGLSERELETLPWRAAAAKINPSQAEQIKRAAQGGDAFAQTLACLGHMAGVPGFLPSPTAASEFCDEAAAQNNRAALYLSWVLQRSTPHAAIGASVARERLAEAARRGLTAAQVDYALQVAPADQVEAGRLLLAAAEHGDARGQFQYARWLRDSPAGPRDPSVAIPYLQRASDAGEVEALHMLATFYRDGVGTPRDANRARALYERAATQDFAPSMFNLADLVRGSDQARATALYAQLACMHDEHQISAMAGQRLRAMGHAVTCA